MRMPPLFLLGLAAACASPQGASAPAAGPPQTAVAAAGVRGPMTLTRDRGVAAAEVGWPPARVWPFVTQAYADIGLPIDHVDQAMRLATATNQRVRRLAGKSPGAFFECRGPYGNTANRDDVFLTLQTQVVPGPGSGSTVRIGAGAVSKSTTGANTITDCASSGALEKLIVEKINERLGGEAVLVPR